jgi:WD40 repeat protein/class 3 adenylate cyclase
LDNESAILLKNQHQEDLVLQIRLLGQFDLQLDKKRITIPTRLGQSLLAYLALTAGTQHRREKLAGTFWPDTTDENARRNLRQELWRIRKALSVQQNEGVDFLAADEFTISFDPSSEYWLDVAQVEKLDSDLESLSRNLSFYQGELLPGFYEDWVLFERERLQSIFDIRMGQLLDQLIAAEHWTAVQEQAERWLMLGNTPEPAFRGLMLAAGARADAAKVSSIYQRCLADLKEQFGLEPSAETRALYEGLLKGTKMSSRPVVAQPSSTVTFLFTDIEGSTLLLETLGDQYAEVLEIHHEIMRNAIRKWNGREVDTQGDSFFVTFTRAQDAVQCAAEMQRALQSYAWRTQRSPRVRMGLHTGEPLISSTGYVGMDVHRAARIGDAAHGGQVLLSQTTRDLVAQDLPQGLTIRDLGEHRLKDLKFPAPIYQLVIEGLPFDFPPVRTRFTGTEAPTPGEPPFKGLQYFDETDCDLFFGRELLTAKLVDRLRETQFLSVIVGASGSGKSSLVRAGLIPALKQRDPGWQVHVLTPTAHPLRTLATELTRQLESVTVAATLIDDFLQDPRSLSLFLARQASKKHILLLIDQLEELFTLCRDAFEREAFIDNLLTALHQSRDTFTLVLTIRADFYAHVAQYPELREAVAKHQEYIGPMSMEELRRAIEEPARLGHWLFEPGLVDLILRDVGDEPGALPLLSHALLETWKRRAGHTLTLQGYANAGGVHGAIAHTAEGVYQSLSMEEQTIARDIFLRLTELGEATEDTRRRASFEELVSDTNTREEVRSVLNVLAEARLITLGEDAAEVAHEALIREWPTLREWLSQDRAGLQLHRRITETAHEWELLERDPGVLYRGAQLAQAREWAALHPNALNPSEKAFLDASNRLEQSEMVEREAQRQRELEAAQKLADSEHRSAKKLHRRAASLAIVLALAMMAALTAGYFANRNAANLKRSDAQRLAAEAINLINGDATNSELSALLSIRSINMLYTPSGDAALSKASLLSAKPRLFLGHTGMIVGAAFSPDSQYLATTSRDKTVRLWDLASGETVRIFSGHTDIVGGVAFSPDGKYIATSSEDKTARLWDVATGETIRIFTGHTDRMQYGPAFSPDGKYLVTGSNDGTARLWDVATGKTVRQFVGHTGSVNGVAFSPDGRYIATGGEDRTARLWDVTTGETVQIFKGHQDGINFVQFSPDGNLLATGGGDSSIRLWQISTGRQVRLLEGHQNWVQALSFSPDGKYLLSGADDRTARLWDVETGQMVKIFTHPLVVEAAAISPNGEYMMSGGEDKIVRIWNMQAALSGMQLTGHTSAVWGASFSPDGDRILTASDDGTARMWNAATGLELQKFLGHTKGVKSAIFSPDGKLVLTTSGDHTARLWDPATGKQLRLFAGHTDTVLRAAFSPDGAYLVTTSFDGTARVWETKTAQTILVYKNQGPGHINRVAYSPDGRTVVTSGADGTARIWNPQTGQDIMVFKGHTDEVTGVAFSPDGRLLLTASYDGSARLWEVATGKEIRRLLGHQGQVLGAAFSPDGKYVLTSGSDSTARLWDVATGTEIRRFTGHTDMVRDAVFSPDGRYILTASHDTTARLWFTDYHDAIHAVCTILSRDLTPEERLQFGISDQSPTCPAQQ